MASLIGWIAIRQVTPSCSASENPNDGIQNKPRGLPWSASLIWAPRHFSEDRGDQFPLSIRELHPELGSRSQGLVDHDHDYVHAHDYERVHEREREAGGFKRPFLDILCSVIPLFEARTGLAAVSGASVDQ